MIYRKLGKTGLKVSVLGIGGGAFFGSDKKKDQVGKIIEYGFRNGITLIETAEDYGEEKIASFIEKIREKIILASKSFSSNKKDMEKSIKNSLRKLATNYIDIYMMHTVDSIESLNFRINNGVLSALKIAKSKGMIKYIGITSHNIPTLIEAVKTNEFDVIEVPYCIGASETEELFDYTKKYGIGVIAMRPLGGGILVDRSKKIHFMNVKNALGYVLSNKNVASALVGVSSEAHLEENLKAINSVNLSNFPRKVVEKKTKEFLGSNFCRGCLACMPCKVHGWSLPIDQLMRMEIFYFKYKILSVETDYKNLNLKASDCTKCKECEKKCPYNVPIIKKMEKLERVFGE
ncbi:MAG: aldo/keto reductase [Candidatus Aenigmatarchaeota archaeon]